jgi:hypothetical protein
VVVVGGDYKLCECGNVRGGAVVKQCWLVVAMVAEKVKEKLGGWAKKNRDVVGGLHK